jgi:hypothetical protein
MSSTNRIRVLVRSRGTGADIFRTLVSLACQDIGPKRLEIALIATDPGLHSGQEARLLHSALDFHAVQVLDARGLSLAQALNLAAADGDAEHLALVPEGARLHPHFLSRSLATMQGRKSPQAVFCEHTAGNADLNPFSRRAAFRPEQLTRRNSVGPVALIQRTAWDILGGPRPAMAYSLWDFWLRLVLAGGRLAQVPGLMASCPPLRRLSPEEDGRAKALLVVHTPGAFEPDVCRWALARLRGETWAGPFELGVIPSPRDVAALFAGLDMPLRPGSFDWDQRQLWSA